MAKKRIIKYHNDINEVAFKGLTAAELDVLFAIFSLMKDKGEESQLVQFSEFRKMTGIKTADKERIIEIIDSTYTKILSIVCRFEDDEDIYRFNVINNIRIAKNREYIEIEPNKQFVKYFNELLKQYTIMELKDIVELNSKYSKNLYRLLIQFRSTGMAYYTVEQIRKGLDVPEAYDSKEMYKNCIKIAIKELTEKEKIENLTCTTIRDEKINGMPTKAYKFEFQAKDFNIIDGQLAFDVNDPSLQRLVEQKNISTKKSKKNSFNNYPQREYDWAELEKKLLSN